MAYRLIFVYAISPDYHNNAHFLLPTTPPPLSPLSPLSSRKRLRAHSDSAIYDSCTAADQLDSGSPAPNARSGVYNGGRGLAHSTRHMGGVIMEAPSSPLSLASSSSSSPATTTTDRLSSQEVYAHRRNIGLCRSQPVLCDEDLCMYSN